MFVIGRLSRQGPPYRIAVWSGGHETLAVLNAAAPVACVPASRVYKAFAQLQIKAKLRLASRRQVVSRGTSGEINLEMVSGEIGWTFSLHEARQLALKVRIVFGACGRRGDVHHIAIARAFMLVFDRVDDVAMPEHGIARF